MSVELNELAPWPLKFDESNLCRKIPGKRFNPSIIDWKGQYLFAFRNGWAGSEIYLVHLNRSFEPIGTALRLDLFHGGAAAYGREDPRLFMFQGKLHIAYIGVMDGPLRTNVLYARISDDLVVEQIFNCNYERRNEWEKNWQFFECEDKLWAIYSASPHKVLQVEGEQCTLRYETPSNVPWRGRGEIRGGAAPVLVDDEFWSFFHFSVGPAGAKEVYGMGVYTFENRPPFRIQRIIPDSILMADGDTRPVNQYVPVIFPCGAVLRDNHWIISCGIHDRWSELHISYRGHLEEKMVRVAPPRWFSFRQEGEDAGMFSWIEAHNEYRLDGIDWTDKVLVDIGSHIGSFAYAAWKRGAKSVHCYEPDERNLPYLRANAEHMPGVKVFGEAVWSHSVKMKREEDWGTGHALFIQDELGDSQSVGIDEVIDRACAESPDGRVARVKIDCEGAEISLVPSCTKWHLVDSVIGEWHGFFQRIHVERALKAAGFTVEVTFPSKDTGLFEALRK